MRTMKYWNYIIALITLIAGIAIILASLRFAFFLSSGDPGPGFWPMVLGSVLILCALLLAGSNIFFPERAQKIELTFSSPAHLRVYALMAAAAVFCVVLYVLGFYIAMLVFMPLCMKIMGMKKDGLITIISLCTLVCIFLAFQIGLKTQIPGPIFWR